MVTISIRIFTQVIYSYLVGLPVLDLIVEKGLIFLHPHPTSPDALIMFIIGESAEALERAARLFPIRTGITVPSWMILGPAMNELGAAGISGAGSVVIILSASYND